MSSDGVSQPLPARVKYVRAVGPRLRLLLYVIFGLVALLGANLRYLEEIEARYKENPQSVDAGFAALLDRAAHFQAGHYVVLYEFGSNGVVLGDPASGIVRLSQELFAQTCSGNLLLVRPQGILGRREEQFIDER